MKKPLVFYILLGGLVFCYLTPYFFYFHRGFSSSSEDYSRFGNYLSGLSALFSGATLLVLIIDLTSSKKEKEIEKIRESIRYIIKDFSIDEYQKNHLVRYYEKKKTGQLDSLPREWHLLHEKENIKIKNRLLYIFKLISNSKLDQVEYFIYKDKIQRLFSNEQREAVIGVFVGTLEIEKLFEE